MPVLPDLILKIWTTCSETSLWLLTSEQCGRLVMLVPSDKKSPVLLASACQHDVNCQHSFICEWNQIEIWTLTSLLSLLADARGWCSSVINTNMETFWEVREHIHSLILWHCLRLMQGIESKTRSFFLFLFISVKNLEYIYEYFTYLSKDSVYKNVGCNLDVSYRRHVLKSWLQSTCLTMQSHA